MFYLFEYGGVLPFRSLVGPGLEDVYGGHEDVPHPPGHTGGVAPGLKLLHQLLVDGLHGQLELLDQTLVDHGLGKWEVKILFIESLQNTL